MLHRNLTRTAVAKMSTIFTGEPVLRPLVRLQFGWAAG